nr:MAG TPA: hypothetical protein [Caudoviricetes sp.]
MENTKIEKKDVVVSILDIIDGAAFGALVGKAVVCFMPKSTKVAINLVLTLVYAALSTKLTQVAFDAIYDGVHALNENIVDSIGDLVDAFKAARTQKNMA